MTIFNVIGVTVVSNIVQVSSVHVCNTLCLALCVSPTQTQFCPVTMHLTPQLPLPLCCLCLCV